MLMHRKDYRHLTFVAGLGVFLLLALAETSLAQSSDQQELAKKTQNPVSDLISVPIQNNVNLGIGQNDRTQNVTNIQPVIPVRAGSLQLINRTIAPLVYQPDVQETSGGTYGLGDINHTVFFSPAKAGKLIWGAGPMVSIPTATDDVLGTGKLGLGPSFVALTMPGRWVIGALVNNIWSVAGDSERSDVNQLMIQYFVNYNLPGGWYISLAPIITSNWKAESGNKWTVPFGGAVGKIFRIGNQALNGQVGAFYNAIHPDTAPYPDWTLRLQIQFLFPK